MSATLAVRSEGPVQLTLDDLACEANREHDLCRQACGAAVEHAIRAGEALIRAKAQVAHGAWLPWLAENFDGSEDTAQVYMRVARNTESARYLADASIAGALRELKQGGPCSERMTRLREERRAAEAKARRWIAELGPGACRIEVADLRRWRPREAAAIITDPPYITGDAIELHSALADFALEALPPHGALAVMTWQPILPAVLAAMQRPQLVYRWTAAWTFDNPERTPERSPRVFDGWKPVLVFHKDGWTEETTYLRDTIGSSGPDKESHEWGQSLDGFRQLVRAFTRAGETVCDPFVGGGTTPVAALAESRLFVGCDVDPKAVATARARLAA